MNHGIKRVIAALICVSLAAAVGAGAETMQNRAVFDAEMASRAVCAAGFSFACEDASDDEAPFIPRDMDGRFVLTSGNAGLDEVSSAVTVVVTAPEGRAFCVDLRLSTEEIYDALYISVDGRFAKAFSGERDWFSWCCGLTEGEHRITFRYVKDQDGQGGDDFVALDEARLIDIEEAAALTPSWPLSDKPILKVLNDGATRIVLTGDTSGPLATELQDASIWILPSTQATLSARLSAKEDPEATFYLSFYDDDSALLCGTYNEYLDAYIFTAELDTQPGEDGAYTLIRLYTDNGELFEPVAGAVILTSEERADEFAAYIGKYDHVELGWTEAGGK